MQANQIYYRSLGGFFSLLPAESALLLGAVLVLSVVGVVLFSAFAAHRVVSAAVVRRFTEKLATSEADEVRMQLGVLQVLLWCDVLACIIVGSDASVHDRWISVILTLLAYVCFSGARIAKKCRKRIAFR